MKAVRDIVSIGIDVDQSLRAKVEWVLECLLAVGDVSWTMVVGGVPAVGGVPRADAAGRAPDIGYGCPGEVHQLPHDPGMWIPATTPPARERDPLACAFWWLARVEETLAAPDALDEHGRFRYAASALAVEPAPAPVDAIAADLLSALGRVPARYPGDKAWAVALTHDIDVVARWNRAGVRRAAGHAARSLVHGRLRTAASGGIALAGAPLWKLRGGDPWRNASAIAELERRYGARSTAYLLAGFHAPADGDQGAYDRWRAQWAREFVAAGGSVGLHGSYTSSVTPGRLADERRLLEDELGTRIADHRFHYLRHSGPDSWPLLVQAGLSSDATLGYAEQPGFRSGFSFPHRAFSYRDDQSLDLVLVPLALMDASLEPRYLDLAPGESAWSGAVRPLLDYGHEHGSAFSVLWHNDKACAGRDASAWSQLYERLLRQCSDTAWLVDTGTLAAHWRDRVARGRAAD